MTDGGDIPRSEVRLMHNLVHIVNTHLCFFVQAIRREIDASLIPDYMLCFDSLTCSDVVQTQASTHTKQVHHWLSPPLCILMT
jgi:hypothetical protein